MIQQHIKVCGSTLKVTILESDL